MRVLSTDVICTLKDPTLHCQEINLLQFSLSRMSTLLSLLFPALIFPWVLLLFIPQVFWSRTCHISSGLNCMPRNTCRMVAKSSFVVCVAAVCNSVTCSRKFRSDVFRWEGGMLMLKQRVWFTNIEWFYKVEVFISLPVRLHAELVNLNFGCPTVNSRRAHMMNSSAVPSKSEQEKPFTLPWKLKVMG